MAEHFNKVSLVVDRDYGSRLESLVADLVLIIDSPANRMAAQAHRQSGGEVVVTTFKSLAGDSAGTACLTILDMVELHHGEYSGGYSVLEVVGASLDEALRSAIRKLGFFKFELSEEGFRASR